MAPEVTRDVPGVFVEKMAKCCTTTEVASLWGIAPSMKRFNDREAQLLLSCIKKIHDAGPRVHHSVC